MLFKRRAILIQDISELMDLIKPQLNLLLEPYVYMGVTEEDAFMWVLEEELELIYHLFSTRREHPYTPNHESNLMPYAAVYSELRGLLPWPLSRLITMYIKAPALYEPDCRLIRLEIQGRDLWIHYYGFPAPPLEFLNRL